ncbi:hypothetical protein CDG76_34565 [Nostoc sp. 'Peltigera membranacea cyanobiont' 210A]|uniref:glycosyltransferase family 61 protein n=1 Tax=Nostoc sp. 'Peltigera membranacea cyanobiont' 210A TaxID=2014529 RepID=UPI000B95BA14|nr:glycosyltransferase family 61 protein [Nostoc sp. 'Peltigera membranacea cyanobiont' 210A]OYD89705.1 hypothetical protein CDG76_34565 [Nostoc sp. 'Peltigera membranacea cyanobiont' 210A]
MTISNVNPDLGDPLPNVRELERDSSRFVACNFPVPDGVVSTTDYLLNQRRSVGTYTKVASASHFQYTWPFTIDSTVHWKFRGNASGVIPERFVAEIGWGRIYRQGVVITPTNEILRDVSEQFYHRSHGHALLDQQGIPIPMVLDKNIAVVSSIASANYFHWLCECLPRLGMLNDHEIDAYYVNLFEQDSRFHEDTLALLGVSPEKLFFAGRDTHVLARKVYVPSLPGKHNHASPYTCRFLRQMLVTSRSADCVTPKKLYVSRQNAARRHVVNEEDEVWPWLRAQGFERVELSGQVSVKEQIHLFSAAEVIVGPFGAGLTNMVFSPPGASIVEFFSPKCVRLHYWSLSNACGHRYGYLLGEGKQPADFEDPDLGNEDMEVDVVKLRALFQVMQL